MKHLEKPRKYPMRKPELPDEDFATLCENKRWTTPREIDEGLIMILANLTLVELLSTLELRLEQAEDKDKPYPVGIGEPNSYRGGYSSVAFAPVSGITLAEMIDNVNSAIGSTYSGFKGGHYTMSEDSYCYIAHFGHCGTPVTEFLLNLMFEDYGEAIQN